LFPLAVYEWEAVVVVSLAFSLGYYSYLALKRRFDTIYGRDELLFKRAIHGVVYMIFLVLAGEAIRVRISGEAEYEAEMLIYLILGAIGIPIFLDIALSIYRRLRRG